MTGKRSWWSVRVAIDSIRASSGASAIARVFSLRLIAFAVGVIGSIIVARTLGASGKGVVAAALAFPMLAASLGGLGYPVSAVYFLQKKVPPHTILANGVFITGVVSAVYVLVCWLFWVEIKDSYYDGVSSSVIVVIAMFAGVGTLFRTLLLQLARGLELYTIGVWARIAESIYSVTLIVSLLAVDSLGISSVICVSVLGIILVNTIAVFRILRTIGFQKLTFEFRQLLSSLSFGLRDYVGQVLGILQTRADLFILVLILDPASLGVYSVAVGLNETLNFLPGAIGFVAFPKLSRDVGIQAKRSIVNKCIKYNVLALSAMVVVFAASGYWLVPLVYGAEFAGAFGQALLLMCGTLFFSVVLIICKFFSGIGRPELKSLVRAANLPIKALLLWVLVTDYGVMGACVAWALSGVTLFSITILVYIRVKREASYG